MIKFKKLLAMAFTAFYCTTLFPVHAIDIDSKDKTNDDSFAELKVNDMSVDDYSKNLKKLQKDGKLDLDLVFDLLENGDIFEEDLASKYSRAIGNTSDFDRETILNVGIPNHTLDGKVAYCLDVIKNEPYGMNYSDAGAITDEGLNAILYHGYPLNKSGMKEKYGLSDKVARKYTQYASWYYYNPSYFRPRSIPYIDELLTHARNKNGAKNIFNISNSNLNTREVNKIQESDIITTSGSKGTFTFPSDSSVWSVDVNGNKKNTFNIGESFKVQALSSVSGNVKKVLTSSVPVPVNQLFLPSNPNYQRFAVPGYSSKNLTNSKELNLNFKGIKGSVQVKKVDENGNPLQSVKFGLFSDSSAKNQIATGTTDNNGLVTFSNLDVDRTYYVKELSGLQGYVVDSSIKAVALNDKSANVTVTNTKIYGQIEVIKKETGLNDSRLQGAEFAIYDSANNTVDTITTGQNGAAVSKKLPYGSYTVKEIKAPHGYTINNNSQTVKIDSLNKTYTLSFENNPIKGSIEILKIDGDNKKPLAGVKFGVYTQDEKLVEEFVTNNDGIAKSSALRFGTYYIQEIEALEGYNLDSTKYQIIVNENNKVYTQTITNSKSHGKIVINKVDATNKKPLSGVLFEVKAISGLNKGMTWLNKTNENGVLELEGLFVGEYEITEISTIDGYVLDSNPIKATIKKDGQVVDVTVENKRIEGRFEFLKYDDSTEEKTPLSDVTFQVKGLSELTRGIEFTFTTDENGTYTSELLPYGTYEIVEVEAKKGYVLDSTPVIVEIKAQDELVSVSKANKQIVGGLDFIKIDADDESKTPLAGAVIQVVGVSETNSDYKDTFESSVDGNRFSLPYGKYELTEISAPEGYIKSDEVIEFEVLEDGQMVTVELENKKILADLEIIKVSAKDKNLKLQGAEFNIYNSDKELIETIVTNEEGVATLNNLPYGTYFYQETKAPFGYIIDKTVYEFQVEEPSVITITVENNPFLPALPDIMEEEEIVDEENEFIQPLPDTSGISPIVLMAGSLVLIIVGGIVVLKRRK